MIKRPWPILWLDADNRLLEMSAGRKWVQEKRVIHWPITSPLIEDSIRARQLSTETRGRFTTLGPVKKQPQGYPKILEMMDDADKFIINNDIRTVVIDPVTRVIEHMSRYLSYQTKHGVIEEAGWGIYLSNLEEFINAALSFPTSPNVILIMHSRDYFDDDKGRKSGTVPLVSGQMQAKIGSYFAEVWYNFVKVVNGEPNFLIQCQPSDTVFCRTSRNLGFTEKPSFPELMKRDSWGDSRFTLMLYGPFGSGKTSTALTLCEVEDGSAPESPVNQGS